MARGNKDVGSRIGNRRQVGIQAADLYSVPTPEPEVTKNTTAAVEKPAPTAEKGKPGRKKMVVTGEAREHFSSSLRPSYKRKIKLAAAVLGINDYEILDQALDEWFAKHKKEIAPDL